MPINSEIIRKKEFHIVFKGYKPEEVDKFLDSLSGEVERLIKKNKEMQENVDRLKFERSNESEDMKKVLQDALVSAHKIAEDIKQKAEHEAKQMYSQKKIESEKEFKELEEKKKKIEDDISNIKKQYLTLKKYFLEALENMDEFESSEGLDIEDQTEDEPKPIEPEAPKKEEQEEIKLDKSEEEKAQAEEEEKEEGQGKKKNNLDIANPDVIDDFFKADE